jgi:hypothetical protein
MKRQLSICLTLIAACIFMVAAASYGAVPRMINYQGKATDASGNPVPDGDYQVRFYIYDHPTAGNFLWGEMFFTVHTTGGLFTHLLGSNSPVPDSLFAKYDSLYLAVMFNYEWQTPRTPLVSTGYAFRVNSVDGASGGEITGQISVPDGIIMGGTIPTANSHLLHMDKRSNSNFACMGEFTKVSNASTGGVFGNYIVAGSDSDGNGLHYGAYIDVKGNPAYGSSLYGVYSQTGSTANTAGYIYGLSGHAYAGAGAHGYGVYGSVSGSGENYAGYFNGNVDVHGALSKTAGSFKIDHPLDPENKYLQHSFVESPDMMNVYNGNVVTDARGYAAVTLPDYFEALNKDFRYQLTVIGQFAQAIVAEKISGNMFTIRTDKPQVEVSWQVTGIRKDKWAEAHRIPVEIDKPSSEQGTYLHPEEFNQPIERSVNWEQINESREKEADRGAQR